MLMLPPRRSDLVFGCLPEYSWFTTTQRHALVIGRGGSSLEVAHSAHTTSQDVNGRRKMSRTEKQLFS